MTMRASITIKIVGKKTTNQETIENDSQSIKTLVDSILASINTHSPYTAYVVDDEHNNDTIIDIPIGDRRFVTAYIRGTKIPRQGIMLKERGNEIWVQGAYNGCWCEDDYAIVPYSVLYGDALALAKRLGVRAASEDGLDSKPTPSDDIPSFFNQAK